VAAKIEVRVEKGEEKVRAVKERKREWHRLNKMVEGEVGGLVGEKVVARGRLKELGDELGDVIPAALNGQGNGNVEADGEWVDDDMGEEKRKADEKVNAETIIVPILEHRPPAEIPLPAEDDDGIL
jgi:hypothetical protein